MLNDGKELDLKTEKKIRVNICCSLIIQTVCIFLFVLFSNVDCFAQNTEFVKHVKVNDPLVQSLPGLTGSPVDLIKISVKKDNFLVCCSANNNLGSSLIFYLEENPGSFQELLSQDFPQNSVQVNSDWVSTWKCSKDQTYQIAVTLGKGCCGNGVYLFSYDPDAKKLFSLKRPTSVINFVDLNGNGEFEILAGANQSSVDPVPCPPLIFNVDYDHLVDVSNQYPDYYKNLIKQDEQFLNQPNHNKYFKNNVEMTVKELIINAYLYAGLRSEGKTYTENLIQDVTQRMKKLKDGEEGKILLGMTLKNANSKLKEFDEMSNDKK